MFALITVFSALRVSFCCAANPAFACRCGFPRRRMGDPDRLGDRRLRLHFRRPAARCRLARPRSAKPSRRADDPGVLAVTSRRDSLKTVMSVFGGVFNLIFTVDTVETLGAQATRHNDRRVIAGSPSLHTRSSPNRPCLCRAARLDDRVLNFSRRLELVVARAAGVSVWQFLLAGPDRGGRRSASSRSRFTIRYQRG